ncbi:MAG: ATP phosphoribosyltransferase [Myxococcales bacterium]|nr:ATP phosphoribosyltransferase [Myxococcales bacterium]MCB9708954.1 ATP phosphoribosyltransferase [Myxococcales bacterium]
MNVPNKTESGLRLALPKGRMADGVFALLGDAGIRVRTGERGYRPTVSVPGFEVKILKPQNIIEMLHAGSRDIGFAGADWVAELDAELVELLDTGMDPVALVAAAPRALLEGGKLPERPLVVASEYPRLTERWMKKQTSPMKFVRSYGATEVFPPEDADCIIDITQTGSTLRANGLGIVDELLSSSTRLYANGAALRDSNKRKLIDDFVLLLRSVLEARDRVMLEVNVPLGQFEQLIAVLPCMRKPTVARLHGEEGYAVKAAVPKNALPALIPALKQCGGTDVVVTRLSQIVP